MLTHSSTKLDPEALIVYGLLMIVGAIPVATAHAQSGAFGVEATVGLIMIGLGALGALGCAWHAVADHAAGAAGGGSRSR